MTLHTGLGAKPGVAIAAAARLRVEYGVASWEPERLRRIAARMRAFGVEAPEPEQVILVADHLPPGPLPLAAGLEVVGIAVGSDTPLIPPPSCPAVTGLGQDWFETVLEDEIVIVDGSRGRVHVSPDAMTVARYQSPSVAARRIFIDEAHLPARTASDGRTIAVYASVAAPEEIAEAMAAGADGIYWQAAGVLPWTGAEQMAILNPMMDTLGGLPLLLAAPLEELSLTALARASAQGPLSLLLPNAAALDEAAMRLAETEQALEEEDARYGTPQFVQAVSAAEDASLPEMLDGFTGILVTVDTGQEDIGPLLLMAGLAHRTHLSLMLALGDDWPAELPRALMLGVTHLVVPRHAVRAIKDAVRAW